MNEKSKIATKHKKHAAIESTQRLTLKLRL